MKRIFFAGALSFTLLLQGATSFADDAKRIAYTQEQEICVYGKLDEFSADSLVSVMMVSNDADLSALSNEEIKYAAIVGVDEEGGYKLNFNYKDGNAEDYMIYVNADGKNAGDSVVSATSLNHFITADLSMSEVSDGIKLAADIKNLFGTNDREYSLVLAFYDNSGALVGAEVETRFTSGSDERTSFTRALPDGASRAKGFMWSTNETMLPVARPAEFSREYAVDSIYNNGFLTQSTGDLNIMFVGDSLTAGDSTYEIDADTNLPETHWTKVISNYFAQQLPNRNVHMYNAGIGGTRTEFAVYGLYTQIIEKEPDIVFIENVNDLNERITDVPKYTESIIRRLAQCKKQPVIILYHAYNPYCDYVQTKSDNEKQLEYAAAKDDIAAKYGVASMDYITYFRNLTKDCTNQELMEKYYNNGNIHPKVAGYNLMGTFAVEELSKNPQKYLKRHTGMVDKAFESSDDNYILTYPSSSRFKYNGFKLYSSYQSSLTGAYNIQKLKFIYPFGGVAQSVSGGDSVEFTTTSAQAIIFYTNPNEKYRCNSVKVYVDGSLKTTGGGSNSNANNFGRIIVGDLDGNPHTIRLETDPVQKDENNGTMLDIFNFLYVAEKE